MDIKYFCQWRVCEANIASRRIAQDICIPGITGKKADVHMGVIVVSFVDE